MSTVNIELRKRPDKLGRCQLRVCILHEGKRSYIPLPVKIFPSEWDKFKQEVINSPAINQQLKLKVNDLEAKILKGVINKEFDKSKHDFKSFCIQCLGRWENTKSKNTHRAYYSMMRKTNEYAPGLTLEEITPDWLFKYENHIRSTEGLNNGGTLKRIAFISTIVHEALRQGLITVNPFYLYRKPKKVNPPKIWLTSDEIKKLTKFVKTTKVNQLYVTGCWFLLSCYTGLRYSDVENFDFGKHIQQGRLILYTQKTGEVVSIKITPQIKELLAMCKKAGPVFTNQKSNQYLKAIAYSCKINKLLTYHTARHTFAVQCSNAGISQEVTSKLLGHSDLRTTAIYYKITNNRIDAEIERFKI